MSPRTLFQRILLAKPTMYSGSVVLNVLGMQFVRILFFYLRRVLRTPKGIAPEYQQYFDDLKRNGVVAIPHFFPPEEYQALKAEYDRLSPSFRPSPSEIELPRVNRLSIFDSQVSTRVRDLLMRNPLVRAMPVAYLNRKNNLPVQAMMTKITCSQEELDLPKNGGTNNVHFDVPMRCLKAFYYVTDADENNAALNYCLGSNRRDSLRRLFLEYKLSIRYAMNKWNPDTKGEYLSNEPWVKITPEEMRANGLHEAPMAVTGNTMVFVDIGGFHRRGEFRKPGVRETIELNYREMETLRNDIYPIEKKLGTLFKPKMQKPAAA